GGGGASLPLDPGYPRERLALMLRASGARLVLADARHVPALPAFAGRVLVLGGVEERSALRGAVRGAASAAALAYVMYTSGSTGEPKGVAVVHRGIVRLVLGSE